MLYLFDTIKDKLKVKPDAIYIDNWVFKLHYRATCCIFLAATILVTAREFIGDSIKCITDMNSPGFEKVVETYCFFTSTFTIINDRSSDFVRFGSHQGILPYGVGSKQEIRKHLYYQWVPFLLFGQAIMFYVPHLIWKNIENNTIESLVTGLKYARYSVLDEDVKGAEVTIPSKGKRDACIMKIKRAFLNHIAARQSWTYWFIFFECVNMVHVILQIYITDKFLGHQFVTLGPKTVINGSQILEEVFPKVSKCTFHKYGHSGSIQTHDALCVLALNIINEKIYVFLWFWFVILFACSCLILLWRFLSMCLYSRCSGLNHLIFGPSHGKICNWNLQMVVKHCTYPEWLLLKYLAKNIDKIAFGELIASMSEDLEEKKPLFMLLNTEKNYPNDFNKFE